MGFGSVLPSEPKPVTTVTVTQDNLISMFCQQPLLLSRNHSLKDNVVVVIKEVEESVKVLKNAAKMRKVAAEDIISAMMVPMKMFVLRIAEEIEGWSLLPFYCYSEIRCCCKPFFISVCFRFFLRTAYLTMPCLIESEAK
ncbi:hypothetical protein FEM48_Zijuj05G0092700 [Ziziphus jujuba var. spinosa]|uniref:Uncharacterized protein n=1 Tax=Ziziphus jujuba var. spinosa TaxID=714518 RepID=A0A978VE43_ZIZJJ|nr:hypothetical protein FEM48_Zijuj05G0092700 [Ziziphus jujuba var. spinosa]